MTAWNPDVHKFATGPNCEGCPFRSRTVGFTLPQGWSYRYVAGNWEVFEPGPVWLNAEYLFLLEAPGKDESRQGFPLVGGTGRYFNGRLLPLAGLRRESLAISNAVLCRPVKWGICMECSGRGGNCSKCNGAGEVKLRQSSGDYVNDTPSPEMVEECTSRYLTPALEHFRGHTIVGLGAVPLSYFAGRGKGITKHRGAIYEQGVNLQCPTCDGSGTAPRPRRKCPTCKGKGCQKCPSCGRFGKHTRKCAEPTTVLCSECAGEKTLPRPPKVCSECHGSKEVPSDPDNPYVSSKLREGQLFLPSFHPAFVMRAEKFKFLLEFDVRRVTKLREELQVEESTLYQERPSEEHLREQLSHRVAAVDFETSTFHPEEGGEIQMMSVSTGAGQACVADGAHPLVSEYLQRAADSDEIILVGQNWMMFDAWWAEKTLRIPPPKRCFDTRLVGHLLNPDTPNNIHYLVAEYANPPIRGYWKYRENYRDNKRRVACIDSDGTWRVMAGQERQLEERGLTNDYWNEVFPTMQVAHRMRRGGWRVNLAEITRANAKVTDELVTLRTQLPEWPGRLADGTRTEGQGERVREYLYETLRLPLMTSKKGQPTADWESRQELLTRLKNGHTSVEKLPAATIEEGIRFLELIDSLSDKAKLLTFLRDDSPYLSGDRFHPVWNPAGTATTRFSCDSPNLQQVPKCACDPSCGGANPNCLSARFPFVGDDDESDIITADYSQIEVIGFLWTAGEWAVLEKCLREGTDAHEVMAEKLGMPRKEAKHMTFAMTYGATDETIAAKSNRPVHQVAEARAFYLKVFPGVQTFRWHYISQAMQRGYVESPFGRRRYLWVRSPMGRAANQAANAPIQGIPPGRIRRAMRELDAQLPEGARLLGNLHDEVIISAHRSVREQTIECVREVMKSPTPELPAPKIGMHAGLVFNVEIKAGPDWARCQSVWKG